MPVAIFLYHDQWRILLKVDLSQIFLHIVSLAIDQVIQTESP